MQLPDDSINDPISSQFPVLNIRHFSICPNVKWDV